MREDETKPTTNPVRHMTDEQYREFLELWRKDEDTVMRDGRRFYKIVYALLGALLLVAVFYVTFAVLTACGVLR